MASTIMGREPAECKKKMPLSTRGARLAALIRLEKLAWMIYSLLKPLLFRMDPERAHESVADRMKTLASLPGGPAILRSLFEVSSPRLEQDGLGLHFPNPIGMAAGFDKSGELYPFLSHMGFGFVESGTFTAHPQPGNPKPRLFRFPEHQALVNRMGFNNAGSEAVAHTIAHQARRLVRGINLGKSKVTPVEAATDDYLQSLSRLQPFADYIAINVSSPNTPGLRSLQEASKVRSLLEAVKKAMRPGLPLFVKLAPDLSDRDLDATLDAVRAAHTDGLILTNTTLDKSSVPAASGMEGGLSGRPLTDRSTAIIRRAYRHTSGRLPIIGVGGIFSGEDALAKIRAGASLVQLYTGYIYEGPMLPARICRTLDRYLSQQNTTLPRLTGIDA